jgi:hypothetical protein
VRRETPDPQNLRTEYAVLGSYISAMTGMRFQTVTIFLAAVGLIVSGDNEEPWSGLLILILSIGLWILDLRNRDLLRKLGDRGIQIERHEWDYPDQEEDGVRSGFFLDRDAQANIRLLAWGPWTPPPFIGRFVRHAVAIDIVFLGVAIYAISLLI